MMPTFTAHFMLTLTSCSVIFFVLGVGVGAYFGWNRGRRLEL